jgi:hypothetical protein
MDVFSSIPYAVIFLVDTSFSSMTFLTTATGLQVLCVLIALLCASNAIRMTPLTRAWLGNVVLSWLFAFVSVFFNADSASIPLSFYLQYLVGSIIFALDDQIKQKSRPSFLLRSLKYLALFWGSSLPFLAATIYFLNASPLAAPFKIEIIDVEKLWAVVRGTPGHIAFAATLVMPFVLLFVYAHREADWVLLPSLIFGSMLAIAVPLQTLGDTVERKLLFAKLQLMLASSLRLATVEYSRKGGTSVWHSRIPAVLAMIVVIISRVIAVKDEWSKPLFGDGKGFDGRQGPSAKRI